MFLAVWKVNVSNEGIIVLYIVRKKPQNPVNSAVYLLRFQKSLINEYVSLLLTTAWKLPWGCLSSVLCWELIDEAGRQQKVAAAPKIFCFISIVCEGAC